MPNPLSATRAGRRRLALRARLETELHEWIEQHMNEVGWTLEEEREYELQREESHAMQSARAFVREIGRRRAEARLRVECFYPKMLCTDETADA